MGFIQQLKQVKKKKAVRIAFSLFLILCSSLLQTYVIQSFINPANLLSAGFTGLAILLDRIAQLYGEHVSDIHRHPRASTSRSRWHVIAQSENGSRSTARCSSA